ncbi:MAG TPA: sulfite exporter TauE/SafE family protein [Haliangiales bacterium]|nr:sulfite exporter TauE/SafE family protein [Haliangiales bacterium]
MTDATLILGAVSAVAATVTGALGYGFSSLTVPVALLFYSSRVLNPALILVEVAVNVYALFLNRRAVRRVWPRVAPMVLGLVPGVAVGALMLSRVAPSTMKTVTFLVLLPLILLQAAGVRWPFRRERAAGAPLGAGVGFLYATTTISGPPLALFFNNQGMVKSDFKVALAIARSAESLLTLAAYASLGLFTGESFGLLPWIVPAVLVGMPLGHWLIRRLNAETFRRVCMSFDAWVVAFGLSRLLPGALGVVIPLTAVGIDLALLWNFFFVARRLEAA